MPNDDDQVHKDIQILAEAKRIRDDEDRSDAVRRLARDKKKRNADIFAGKGSTAGKLKSQRESMESGDASLGRTVVGGISGLDATGEPLDE